MYVGQWPVFHGSKLLPYVLKTILKDKCHNFDISSMRCKDVPYYIYVGQ